MKKLFLFVLLVCLATSVFAWESKQITPADAQINASQTASRSILEKDVVLTVDFGRNREVLFDQTLELINWSFGTSDANSSGPYSHADNFFDVVGTITGVSFTGLCLGYDAGFVASDEDPMTFDINFYADNAGAIGNLVVTHEVTLDRVAIGQQFSGFDAFTWTGDLPAGVEMAEGWISIVGTSIGTPLDGWLMWGNSPDGDLVEYADDGTGWTLSLTDPPPDRCFTLTGTVAAPVSPAAPSDFVAVPDAGGALICALSWINPSLDYAGNTLTDLDEINLYRGTDLIYTDSAPIIGDPGNWSDVVTASETYSYSVVGVNDAGEGVSANAGPVWIGEDVPNVVTDLLLVQTTPGVLSGTLTWVNPTIGLNGGAFNEAILGYHIIRNGVEMFEVTGEVTEYIDLIIPSAGNYCYTVQPYNSIGDGGVETSNVVLIADAGLLIMEGFDDGVIPAGWSVVGLGQGNWSIVATANATGTAPELQFDWFPSFTGESRLVTQQVDTSGMTELVLEFKHFLDDYSLGGYSLGFQSTSDGTTWNDVVVYNPTGDMGPETVTETFTNADVGSSTFQLAVYFNGYTFDLDDWYVDDIMLSGDGTLADPVEVAPIYTELLGNYPNPFNPSTKINFSIKDDSRVSLQIYNMKGQLVKSLLNEVIETGDHTISWNGTDNSNKSVSSGVYFYKMKTPNFTATKKMILMK